MGCATQSNRVHTKRESSGVWVSGRTDHVARQNFPLEIEKLTLRPDISNHFASILSTNLIRHAS